MNETLAQASWLAYLLLGCWLLLLGVALFSLLGRLRRAEPLPGLQLSGVLPAPPDWLLALSGIGIVSTLGLVLLGSLRLDAVGPYTIAGHLPWSDASGWLHGTFRLLYEGVLDDWVVRRPLQVVLWSAHAFLSGSDYVFMLIARIVLISICLLVLLQEYCHIAGRVASVFALFLIPLFAAPFLTAALSEANGLSFGVLGFAFLLRGVRLSSVYSYAFGALLLAIALSIRMGPMGILFAVVLWPLLFLPSQWREKWRWSVAAAVSIAVVAGLSSAWTQAVYPGGNSVGANYAYTWYGLAHGGEDWYLFYAHYPEMRSLPEAEQVAYAYAAAWSHILQSPHELLIGMLGFTAHYWRDLFVWAPAPLNHYLLVPFAIGVARLLWTWRTPVASLTLLCWLGAMATAAIIYWSTNAMRVYIVTAPVDCLIVAVGVAAVVKLVINWTAELTISTYRGKFAWTTGLVMLSLVTVIPATALVVTHRAPPEFESCEDGARLSVLEMGKSSVFAQWKLEEPGILDAGADRVQKALENAEYPLNVVLRSMRPGDVLIHGYDFENTASPVYFIADDGILSLESDWIAICSVPSDYTRAGERTFRFYRVQSVQEPVNR